MAPACKECGHYRKAMVFGSPHPVYQCMRPIPIPRDLVIGNTTKPAFRNPWRERKRSWFRDRCGPEGKYFSILTERTEGEG